MMNRREAFQLITLATVLLPVDPALAQDISLQDLAEAGPLGDIVLGSSDAKVTMVEYASLTCGHCAVFHKETFPELKKRFIDTGKVRFILREFPLDPLAMAGFMLARCNGEESYYPITDLLFDHQKDWAFSEKPLDSLQKIMRQADFSQEKFESCLKDQKLYDAVTAVKRRGADTFKVTSTPTFFINGQRHVGNLPIGELEKILAPLLGS